MCRQINHCRPDSVTEMAVGDSARVAVASQARIGASAEVLEASVPPARDIGSMLDASSKGAKANSRFIT
jgi:hypothetical protein